MNRKLREIRLDNLIAVIKENRFASTVAKACGTSDKYLSAIINGVETPGGTTRGVGDELAEKIEKAFHKPEGWMDIDHTLSVAEEEEEYRAHFGFIANYTVKKLKILEMLSTLNDANTDAVYTLLTSLTQQELNKKTSV